MALKKAPDIAFEFNTYTNTDVLIHICIYTNIRCRYLYIDTHAHTLINTASPLYVCFSLGYFMYIVQTIFKKANGRGSESQK